MDQTFQVGKSNVYRGMTLIICLYVLEHLFPEGFQLNSMPQLYAINANNTANIDVPIYIDFNDCLAFDNTCTQTESVSVAVLI